MILYDDILKAWRWMGTAQWSEMKCSNQKKIPDAQHQKRA
jgi:hypothetical protein